MPDEERRSGEAAAQGTAAVSESEDLMRDFTKLPKNATVQVKSVTKNGDRVLDLDGMQIQIGHAVGEELLAALTRSYRPYAGFSIFDRIMQELDAVIDRLMAEEADDRDPGRAEAFCRALALIRDPYEPDYEAERERQMERWEKRNADE